MPDNNKQYFGRDLEAMSFAINYHTWILDEIRPYLGKRLLEVGAGCGNFSDMLMDDDPEMHCAVEPSENMYPLLKQNLESHANAITLQGTLAEVKGAVPEYLDTAIYINVLEHIPDDKAEVRMLLKMLQPGGHLCIFVPALKWLYGTADANVGHERRYVKKELEALVCEQGFVIEKSKYFDIAGIIPWWLLFCVMKKEAVLAGQVSAYDKLVIPVMRRLEKLIIPPIGKNLLLVAKKPD